MGCGAKLMRIVGSLGLILAGVFTWLVIGFLRWVCTFGWHRKLGRGAAYAAAVGAGFAAGWRLMVGLYAAGEIFGWLLGRC